MSAETDHHQDTKAPRGTGGGLESSCLGGSKSLFTLLHGHCLDELRKLPVESVQTCITSPPYWGLRDYKLPPSVWDADPACEHEWGDEVPLRKTGGTAASTLDQYENGVTTEQIAAKVERNSLNATTGAFCQRCHAWRGCFGLEPTPALYVAHSVAIFEEVRRVLKPDGTLWLNLGDSYATGAGAVGNCPGGGAQGAKWAGQHPGRMKQNGLNTRAGASMGPMTQPNRLPIPGLKPKDLVGIPWRVAFALQEAGWWLRSDIIWHKPNPMPESVTDRPTKSHEYLFLLTKSERYYYDAEAIKEPCGDNTHPRRPGNGYKTPDGWDTSKGEGGHGSFHKNGREKGRKSWNGSQFHTGKTGEHQLGRAQKDRKFDPGPGNKNNPSFDEAMKVMPETRNKRTVWTVATAPFPEAHFATYPPALIQPCILAGSRPGDVVLDPFGGSGTTAAEALRLGRRALTIELQPDYLPMIEQRCHLTPGLPL